MDINEMDKFEFEESSFKIENLVHELDDELKVDRAGLDSFDIEVSLVDLCGRVSDCDMMGNVDDDILEENIRKIHEYLDNDKNEEDTLLKRLRLLEESLDSIINSGR